MIAFPEHLQQQTTTYYYINYRYHYDKKQTQASQLKRKQTKSKRLFASHFWRFAFGIYDTLFEM